MQIDDGIPIPADSRRKWPMAGMEVGQSSFIPGETVPRANNVCQQIRYRKGSKFTCRSVTENGVSGVRVWRVE